MRINQNITLCSAKVVLVPYCRHHVPIYHEWMKDPDIQAATASEPLSLEEEYSMQRSWSFDPDKLTFIVCLPQAALRQPTNHTAEIATMIGDVNMFITQNEQDDGTLLLAGELELMIATKNLQHKGLGRAALLCFLRYITEHEAEIVEQFQRGRKLPVPRSRFDFLTAKIGEDNMRSLGLFESIGFVKTASVPSYFGEFELRHSSLTTDKVSQLLQTYDIHGYSETYYQSPMNAEKTSLV